MSAGMKVVEGWEDHPASLGVTVTLVGVGVLGPGVAGVLGLVRRCVQFQRPFKVDDTLLEPVKFKKMRQKTHNRY